MFFPDLCKTYKRENKMDRLNKKIAWRKPKLTILVRNNPEEAVLYFCKRAGHGTGPHNSTKCNQDPSTPGGMNRHCLELSKS